MKKSYESSASVDIDPTMRVEWDRQARADLAKLSKRDADRIEKALARLAEDEHGDIQRVRRGRSACYRLRVGRFRVVFEREQGDIRVKQVHHRREAYRKSSGIYQGVPVSRGIAEDDLLADFKIPAGDAEHATGDCAVADACRAGTGPVRP